MPVYRIDPNPHRVAYGTAIGIILLNTRFPMTPGQVGKRAILESAAVAGSVRGACCGRGWCPPGVGQSERVPSTRGFPRQARAPIQHR